jgi:hypothetical protein
MMEKLKSIGILAGGVGLLIIAIAFLISVLVPDPAPEKSTEVILSEIRKIVNSPEYAEFLRQNLENHEMIVTDVETKQVR